MRWVPCIACVMLLVACGSEASGGESGATGSTETSEAPECPADPSRGTAPLSSPPLFAWDTPACTQNYVGVGDLDGDGTLELLSHAIVEDECPAANEPGVCTYLATYCVGGIAGAPSFTTSHGEPGGAVIDGVSAPGDVDGDGLGDFVVDSFSLGGRIVHGQVELDALDFHDAEPSLGHRGNGGDPAGFVDNFDGLGQTNLLTALHGSLSVWRLADDGAALVLASAIVDIPGSQIFAVVGDVDGDGRGDVAWLDQTGQGAVFHGGELVDTTLAALAPERLSPLAFPGAYAIARAGDLDGDGRDELAIAVELGELTHRLYVIFGAALPSAPSPAALAAGAGGFMVEADEAIRSVAAIGDFNGDGFDDLAVETRLHFHVLFGRTETFPDTLDAIARGCGDGRSFHANGASSPRWTGDLDLDGRADIGTRSGVLLTTMLD